jgi:hypothetical protein
MTPLIDDDQARQSPISPQLGSGAIGTTAPMA